MTTSPSMKKCPSKARTGCSPGQRRVSQKNETINTEKNPRMLPSGSPNGCRTGSGTEVTESRGAVVDIGRASREFHRVIRPPGGKLSYRSLDDPAVVFIMTLF